MHIDIEWLKSERNNLEVRYAAQRSLLDRIIDHAEQTASPLPTMAQPVTVTTTTPPPAPRPKEQVALTLRKPIVTTAKSRPASSGKGFDGGPRDQVRKFAGKHKEFTLSEVHREYPRTPHSSLSVACFRLTKSGELDKVGFGKYRATSFLGLDSTSKPNQQELAYRAAREAMQIAPLPEVNVNTVLSGSAAEQ